MMRYVGSHVPCPAELKVAGVLERLGCQEDVQAQTTVENNTSGSTEKLSRTEHSCTCVARAGEVNDALLSFKQRAR
jgi:hypothetical protein